MVKTHEICLDYILWMSIDLIKENGFTLKKARSRQYLAETITNTDYADHQALLANAPALSESLLHSLDPTVWGIDLYMNSDKTEFMCFKQPNNLTPINLRP